MTRSSAIDDYSYFTYRICHQWCSCRPTFRDTAVHVDVGIVLAGAIIGCLVGLTGSGGGALVTPALVFVFGVHTPTAVASDLVAALAMRPVGAAVHLRRGPVDLRLGGRLAAGSVPGALAGTALAGVLGSGSAATRAIDVALGVALVGGAVAMSLRGRLVGGRAGISRAGAGGASRPVTVALGAACGLLVGLTSVGSGSLMIVVLLALDPAMDAHRLVSADLLQSVPLTGAAAIGAMAFGHVDTSIVLSLIAGAVPAVAAGAVLSERVPERLLLPAVAVVVLASGLRCLGFGLAPIAAVCLCAGATASAAPAAAVFRRRSGVT